MISSARGSMFWLSISISAQWPHTVVAFDPFAERFGIYLHLLLKRRLHFRRGVDRSYDIGESLVRLLELLARDFALGDTEIGRMMPHGQQGHHQFHCVGFRQPRHVVVDDALDGVSCHVQVAAEARRFVETEGVLVSHQIVEGFAQRSHVPVQAGELSAWLWSIDPSMVSRLLSAMACAYSKLATRLSFGLTLKSFTTIRIDATALLKSRLASARAADRVNVSNVRPTSPSPEMYVSPFAKKPATGMSARLTMRVRTENDASIRCKAGRVNVYSNLTRTGRA